MNKVYLSVIIPVYNEENRLNKTLEEADAYLKTQSYSYEIVVVNDGSQDNTVQLVEKAKLKIANLRLLDNQENHGKGFVVKQGMTEVLGQYRLFSDADNSVSINQIEKIWPVLEQGYKVVIGSRTIKGAVISPSQPWLRRLVGKTGNLMIQTIGGLSGIWDSQCGFKCFTADSAQNIFNKITINRWGFDVEALILAKKLGYQVKEIPVIWKNNIESRVRPSGIFKTLFEVLLIRWNLIINKYNL